MTLHLDLPSQVVSHLTELASAQGLSLEQYAAQVLTTAGSETGASATPASSGDKPRTGAELVARLRELGVLGSRGDVGDSSEYARRLRAVAERRGRTTDERCE